jgi:hypothetical protein
MGKLNHNPENDNQTQSLPTVDDRQTPIPVEVDEAAVTAETDVEVLQNSENVQLQYELMPGVVTVDENQLNELMDQNVTMKTEIGLLVGLFKNFEGLISGKANIMSLTMMLPKLIGNPEISAQIEAIQPIIEKYAKTK